jgi:hypothetical protein
MEQEEGTTPAGRARSLQENVMTGFRQILPSVLILPLVVGLSACPALAGYSLGAALDYGVLVESGAHSYQLNNSTINGNVGIGANLGSGGVQIASNGFIKLGGGGTGRLDIVDASATVSNPGNVAGGVHFSQSQVTIALSTVNSLNTTLGAESGTTLTISGSGQTVLASSGTLDGSGNHVFTVVANGFNNNSGGFTIQGSSTDYVVINIDNGTSNESFQGPINLTGGITSDHVLLNFVGTSGNLGSGSTNGAAINADILAPNMAVNLDNMVINGRLFGGLSGQDFQTVSGFTLNQPVNVPEPSSVALLGLGGLAATAARLRRRWRRRGA